MTPSRVAADPWTERRRRAAELGDRWPFASEVLTFYRHVLDAQERVYEAVLEDPPEPDATVPYVARQAVPLVCEVAAAHGPEPLRQALGGDEPQEVWEARVRAWLGGEDVAPAHRFAARAAAAPVLEALGERAGAVCSGPRGDRRCPRCGGLPQLSLFAPSPEDLVAPRRFLECSRCSWRWPFPRMTCPACGETDTGRLPIYAEEGTAEVEATGNVVRGVGGRAPHGGPGGSGSSPRFPHLSIHACRSCHRYLLNVDCGRDPRAVSAVDEIAALPLDLYAREQGVVKIVPNLMGF